MTQGIKEKDIRDFEKYLNKLCEVVTRIRTYNPEAHIYVACDEFHLMSEGCADLHGKEAQEYIVTSQRIPGTDCGDW